MVERRKPDAARKDEVIRVRVTAEQKATFEEAATLRGLDVSGWLRMVALAAAEKGRVARGRASTSDAAWPLVDVHDSGGTGRKGACFCCHQGVGYPHTRECLVVTKRVELRVRATLRTGEEFTGLDERKSGTVTWDTDDPWGRLAALYDGGNCLCGVLRFEFVRVVDPTPRREIRVPVNEVD